MQTGTQDVPEGTSNTPNIIATDVQALDAFSLISANMFNSGRAHTTGSLHPTLQILQKLHKGSCRASAQKKRSMFQAALFMEKIDVVLLQETTGQYNYSFRMKCMTYVFALYARRKKGFCNFSLSSVWACGWMKVEFP